MQVVLRRGYINIVSSIEEGDINIASSIEEGTKGESYEC